MEGYGDRLASGARSAIFGPTDGAKISDAKWKAAFEGFDAEDFKKNGYKDEGSTEEKERNRS